MCLGHGMLILKGSSFVITFSQAECKAWGPCWRQTMVSGAIADAWLIKGMHSHHHGSIMLQGASILGMSADLQLIEDQCSKNTISTEDHSTAEGSEESWFIIFWNGALIPSIQNKTWMVFRTIQGKWYVTYCGAFGTAPIERTRRVKAKEVEPLQSPGFDSVFVEFCSHRALGVWAQAWHCLVSVADGVAACQGGASWNLCFRNPWILWRRTEEVWDGHQCPVAGANWRKLATLFWLFCV